MHSVGEVLNLYYSKLDSRDLIVTIISINPDSKAMRVVNNEDNHFILIPPGNSSSYRLLDKNGYFICHVHTETLRK